MRPLLLLLASTADQFSSCSCHCHTIIMVSWVVLQSLSLYPWMEDGWMELGDSDGDGFQVDGEKEKEKEKLWGELGPHSCASKRNHFHHRHATPP